MNMVRLMMFSKNVKLMFWGDALLCATYFRNRITSHACWVKYALSNSTLNCQPGKGACEMQTLYVQD